METVAMGVLRDFSKVGKVDMLLIFFQMVEVSM